MIKCKLTQLLKHSRKTVSHIISPQCFHLAGPNGVKAACSSVTNALKAKPFRYVIRGVIKGYYASIDHWILLEQLNDRFDDAILKRYFHDIVTVPIDRDGVLSLPTKGIPRRSSVSPFFGCGF